MRLHKPEPTIPGVPFPDLVDVRASKVAVVGAAHGTPHPANRDVAYEIGTGSAGAAAAIRRARVQSSSNLDHWDFDLGGPLLGDGPTTLLEAGAVPVLLGGDDSHGISATVAARLL